MNALTCNNVYLYLLEYDENYSKKENGFQEIVHKYKDAEKKKIKKVKKVKSEDESGEEQNVDENENIVNSGKAEGGGQGNWILYFPKRRVCISLIT